MGIGGNHKVKIPLFTRKKCHVPPQMHMALLFALHIQGKDVRAQCNRFFQWEKTQMRGWRARPIASF